ncbi:MAG: HAMP domain-containing histidine kinase [Clostridia bacterium]|nr:HAMP domain-containing histidine kinase [Clostridia bacterium]
MKNKLFRNFYLLNVITVLLAMIMMMIILSVSVGNYLTKEKRILLFNYCNTVSMQITDQSNSHNFEYTLINLMQTGKIIDSDVLLADTNGKIAYCICDDKQNCPHKDKYLPSLAVSAAVSGRYYGVTNLEGIYSDAYHIAGVPIFTKEGEVAGLVFAATPASLLEQWLRNFSLMFVMCAILPLVMTCVVVYITTYRMLKPLRMMNEAAHSLASGDFSKRIYSDSKDEISELAESFNMMTDSLAQLEGMRRSFIANVSHELRTPMTTISGFIDGILDGTIEPEKQKYYLEIVSAETNRLKGIVQTMLYLARLESGEQEINKTRVDLFTMCCSVMLSQEQRITAKNIEVRGLDEAENISVLADNDLCYQVVYNLVDNAIKFTPENGYISISVSENGKEGIFKVQNSGQGIAKEDMPKVFERFYKTDKSRSVNKDSSGLGLYIVKSIIDLSGGRITVRSVLGEYTEFEVALPIETEKGELNGR